MYIRGWILLLIALWLLAGCATAKGFNRGEMTELLTDKPPVYNESDIKAEFEKKPNLPKRFKLAVYFKNPSSASGDKSWRWTDRDKEILGEIEKQAKADGFVSEVIPILNHVAPSEDLKTLRLAAARHHADALMIINGTADVDRYTNNWSWTYLFILPAMFVPASEADTLFMTSASLWDVRNEYLYLTASGEGAVSDTHAAAFGKNDKELIEEAKTVALTNLKAELGRMIKGSKL